MFTRVILSVALFSLVMAGQALAFNKADYQKKVKTNDYYVGVVAAVVNILCPKLVNDTKICNPKDPVGSAVAIQTVMMGGVKDIDDREDEDIAKVVTNLDAAMQFYDAVEQFKGFLQYKGVAGKFAKKRRWTDATMAEEQAWQHIVKTASRAKFAAKMLNVKLPY